MTYAPSVAGLIAILVNYQRFTIFPLVFQVRYHPLIIGYLTTEVNNSIDGCIEVHTRGVTEIGKTIFAIEYLADVQCTCTTDVGVMENNSLATLDTAVADDAVLEDNIRCLHWSHLVSLSLLLLLATWFVDYNLLLL
jgi:hypothetical protein